MIRDFTGSEIRVVAVGDLGHLVSVTLSQATSGSTTFTLFLPRVNLPDVPLYRPVTTEGVTTIHRMSAEPPGQKDFYTVTTLHGSAV
jgi:hypothetical protein